MKSFYIFLLRVCLVVIMPASLFAQITPIKKESQPTKVLQTQNSVTPSGSKSFPQSAKPLTPTPELVRSYNWYRQINPNNILSVINPVNTQQLADPSIQAYMNRKEMNLTGWINQNLDLGVAASCDSLVHLKALPNLAYIRFRSYPSDACFVNLAGLQQIKFLQYAGASSTPENLNITDVSMSIIGTFYNLEFLDIFSCGKVTDNGFARLAGLINLKELNLNHWTGLTPGGLQYIQHMKKLEKLRLIGDNLNDDTFKYLTNLTQLNFLNCTRAKGLTDRAADVLIAMLANMPRLTQINLQFTGVSEDAKNRIRTAYPGVSVW
jgi:hypothetical protein